MDFSLYKGKKILLTGHTGFKGSWLAEWLLSLGAEVTGFSIDVPTEPSHFETLGLSERLQDWRGDVRDLAALKMVFSKVRPDLVFHLAAQPLVRASYDQPLETMAVNAMGTANLLEAVRLLGSVRGVVVVTTDKCYENRGWEFGYREVDSLGGHDPYSASKAAAEIITSSYARSFFSKTVGTRICSARAGNVIGGGDWALDRLVPDCVQAWIAGKAAEIRNPHSIRPWQHVLEPLAAYLLLGIRLLSKPEGVQGEAFNFGPGAELDRSVMDLVLEMEKSWSGVEHVVQQVMSTEKKEAHTLRLSCDKAQSRLRWAPCLSFEETILWTSEWYQLFAKDPRMAALLTKQQIAQYQEMFLERIK